MASSQILFGVPISDWVKGTVDKIIPTLKTDSSTWNRFWFEQYQALGGRSVNSGDKGCPRAAARGLWLLGLLTFGQRQRLDWSSERILRELGKNATYSSIACELMHKGASPNAKTIWPEVRRIFADSTGESAANSEQGEIRLTVALFVRGHIDL